MKTLRLAPVFGALLVLAGCGNTNNATTSPGPGTVTVNVGGTSPGNTLVENVMAIDELSMLASAIERAGLADELSGAGPYTLFAPTNDAFRLADVDMTDTEALQNVLLYHVADERMSAGDLTDGMILVMMNGEEAGINSNANDRLDLNIDDAEIVATDIASSNGVIHLINLVLNPTPGSEGVTD